MEHLAAQLARIGGVVAVTLGGSRARGDHLPDSDWDFGLYYRGDLAVDDVRALGYPGRVFGPGDWGTIVNGGAWLTVDGQRVDLVYRDLDEVLRWTHEAEAGRFEVRREVGYVAGIATYVLTGELALGRVLHGELPRPGFPDALRTTAPRWWFHIAAMALEHAAGHVRRDDATACCANVTVAALATAQGRLAAAGEWALNEKQLLRRAGLDAVDELLRSHVAAPAVLVERVAEVLAHPQP